MKNIGRWLWVAVAVVVLWYLRPFIHPLLMSFVISPLRLILIIFFVIGVYQLAMKLRFLRPVPIGPGSYTLKAIPGFNGKAVGVYFVVIVGLLIAIGLEGEFRLLTTSKKIAYDQRTELPDFDQVRLTPKQVASRYAKDTFQNPQEQLGDSQIALIDGKLQRVFPKLPDGGLLYFIRKLTGFVVVEVDTLDRTVNISNQEFKYSEGIGITDNLYFQLLKKKYFVSYTSEPIYLKDDAGQWVTAVPYITYSGFPFRVPNWGGVMIVKSDGTITDYTPAEAQNLSYAKNNRLYPKELSEYYAHSYSYDGGLLNKWFLHKNQVEIVSLPGDETIIHASTTEGFKQVIVAEPYGRSYGIYKIFIFDATTGKRELISFDENSQLTGPVAAADYIKKFFPTYDWSGFALAEPRPIKINGQLNWLMSVIPSDSAGIATTVLLDAKSNKVTEVKTKPELEALIAGQTTVAPNSTATDTTTDIKTSIEEIQRQLDKLKTLLTPTPSLAN